MRASTLFALTVAVLIGLGVAIAAKVTGLFARHVEPPPKPQPVNVLAAGRNLFAGDLIDSTFVYVRPLKAEELPHYQQHKDQYLPPLVAAAYLRVAAKNIEADQPILKDALKEMTKPEPLNSRILPQMRAVNVSVTKDQSAGGLIQVGEWVDVYLTTQVETGQGAASTRTACICPRVRIIAKRNTLWPLFAPIPDDKPIQYTLEINPYRAALLEYAHGKGQLTLVLLPGSEQEKLETRRDHLLHRSAIQPVNFLEPGTQEAAEEEARVSAFLKGEGTVGDSDLVRIFGLSTPPPPLLKKSPVYVEQYVGTKRLDPAGFGPDGRPLAPVSTRTVVLASSSSSPAGPTIQFRAPADCGSRGKT